jgi:hypothetical protein
MRRILQMACIVVAAVGCSSSQNTKSDGKLSEVEQKVITQAAFELQCDKANLTIAKISDDASMLGVKNQTYGVRGCDKQATYKTSCGMGSCNVFNVAQAQTNGHPM